MSKMPYCIKCGNYIMHGDVWCCGCYGDIPNIFSGIADPAGFVEAAKELISEWSYRDDVVKKLRKAWKGSVAVEDAIAEIVKDVPDEVLDKMKEE